ncbi:GNAT family N-acetyltransferase [Pukyongiella litopenaei]|uniref:GNAT family N-acetyltransferase n=1 Tax=Pukyongiella litopenaei TaxID=2605946 RepID=A0A2S0MLZ8_9RHOB|nr:GNAT family N-acetyltransferase [Pukyongiella litopenaei]AVO36902.1 GNAT family N-acetyltransferase [Pukyongiella litopenaei]
MTASIRQAVRSDAERLDAALAALAGDLGDPYRATPAGLERAGWGRAPAFRAQIAEAGTDLAGLALYSPGLSTVMGGPGLYVSDLWVAPGHRSDGLGQRLLAAAFADAAHVWGACFLRLQVYDRSPAARRFYDRLGFVPSTGHTDLFLDEAGCAALKGET